MVAPFYICSPVDLCVLDPVKVVDGFQIMLYLFLRLTNSSLVFPATLFTSWRVEYLWVHLCRVIVKAMKMSRRSADASQRALAYNRMVDGLNEFRLGDNSDPDTHSRCLDF